jgi:hypothetical protein
MNLDLRLPVGVLFIMLAILLMGYALLGPRQAAVVDFGVSRLMNLPARDHQAYDRDQVARIIALCPAFWGLATDAERAGAIIHEAVHMRLNFANHGHGSRAQRGSNPECYTSMAADVFNWVPFDARCPPI